MDNFCNFNRKSVDFPWNFYEIFDWNFNKNSKDQSGKF